jgi:hypothetical protein
LFSEPEDLRVEGHVFYIDVRPRGGGGRKEYFATRDAITSLSSLARRATRHQLCHAKRVLLAIVIDSEEELKE